MVAHVMRLMGGWSLRAIVAEAILLGWLMIDQGIFALTNFVTNIFFARWLPPADYGLFAVSFTGYLLLTVFHYGTILEPLLVQSARVEPYRQRSYIRVLIIAHVAFIGIMCVLSGIGYVIARQLAAPEIALTIIGAGIGGSFMCTLLASRRLCLIFFSARSSAIIGSLYMAGVTMTTYLLHTYSQVNWFDLWLVMGAWAGVCSTVIFAMLYGSLTGTQSYTFRELCQFQWRYARYGLLAAICSWIRGEGIFLLLAATTSLEVIGQTRAVLNLANPLTQINIALNTSWLVAFSRNHSLRRLWQTVIIYGSVATCVVVSATLFGPKLIEIIYSGRFQSGAWLLAPYCLAVSFIGLEAVFSCFFKAGGSLRHGYAPQIIGSMVSVIVGVALIPSWGPTGFVLAMIASFVVGTLLAFSLALRRR